MLPAEWKFGTEADGTNIEFITSRESLLPFQEFWRGYLAGLVLVQVPT